MPGNYFAVAAVAVAVAEVTVFVVAVAVVVDIVVAVAGGVGFAVAAVALHLLLQHLLQSAPHAEPGLLLAFAPSLLELASAFQPFFALFLTAPAAPALHQPFVAESFGPEAVHAYYSADLPSSFFQQNAKS